MVSASGSSSRSRSIVWPAVRSAGTATNSVVIIPPAVSSGQASRPPSSSASSASISAEQLLARAVGQVGDEVGGVVGRHLLEDVGGALGGEALEHLDLGLGLHLLDGVGDGLVVERGQDAGPVARRELVDDRRQVGRVELGQAGVRDAQPDRGDARLDRVDVLPVDVSLRRRQPQVAGQDPVRALDPEPAQQPGRPDIDRHQVEPAVDVVEAQVVDAHDLAPVDVDDLLVEQVGAQPDLVRPLRETGDVDGGARQARAAGIEPGDLRPGQEDAPPIGRDDEAGDRRVAVADGDDEIVDLAQRLPVGVEHGSADGLAQVEHGCHLACGTSRRGWRDPGGRDQPSGSGTERFPGDDGAFAVDGTGTVVHGSC